VTTKVNKEQGEKVFFSPEQLANMLHVSVKKIYGAIEGGQLPAKEAEGNYTISSETVRKFLQDGNPFAL